MGVNTKISIFLLIALIKNILGANILYVAPIPSPSHHIWNKALTMGLLEKGHNVTMLTHATEKAPQNFTVITMEGFLDVVHEMFDMEDYADESILGSMALLYDFLQFNCQYDYNTTGFRTLLNYPADYKFDLIIIDTSLGSRCYYPLIERFNNPPAVVVTPFMLPPLLSGVFGNHLYTSYMPYSSTQYTSKMNFPERILNFIYTYADILYRNYISLPKEDAIIKQHFGEHKFSPEELERNVSLLLCNTDPVLDYPNALPPNIIPVGGLHARPSRALPKEMQKIMDEAKHGVILFSLGTNVRSDQLGLTTRQALLNAFAKLPQIVIWKFETDEIEGLPKNVIIRKWLPQNDILGHPNIKLFINHGGALSTQEAMYHGVPVIGIPFFADQHVNIRKMEERKVAKQLDRKKLTTEIIYETVKEVLYSDVYKGNMRDLSKRYHDQPQTALERAIFWIEYLIRHGSAEHLVLAARDMPAYQTANLDVVAAFVLILIFFYAVSMFVFTCCKFVISLRHYNGKPKVSKQKSVYQKSQKLQKVQW